MAGGSGEEKLLALRDATAREVGIAFRPAQFLGMIQLFQDTRRSTSYCGKAPAQQQISILSP